ncbi:MAG: glycerol kinase GlpK [Victivallales bacterium]
MKTYVMALDQGTTSSRAIVFDRKGGIAGRAHQEFNQIFPKPGWVEHNPEEIWNSQKNVAMKAMRDAGVGSDQIASIGITNQRETTILWDRKSGRHVYNAIVWQCRRTSEICKSLELSGKGEIIRKKTGLLLDAYFSATKIKWILDSVPGLRERAEKGDICFGTVDSWLIFKLTGEHRTDITNASRTMLLNIRTGKWDSELLDIFGIPEKMLPEIRPSSCLFGKTLPNIFGRSIEIGGVAGDQQASLFGQACFRTGSAKNTYGTGCFMLVNTGRKPEFSNNRLLTTVAWEIGKDVMRQSLQKHGVSSVLFPRASGRSPGTAPGKADAFSKDTEYALEGSVFTGGAVVKWLRDSLKIIRTAAESEKLAMKVPDTGGVYFVPAFVGLGAPYWDPDARGSIFGMTRGTSAGHLARAALESIAFQSRDLVACLQQDIGHKINSLKVDGGASTNNFLMQFQSDILGIPVVRSAIAETTALGAAYLAGLNCGYWDDKRDIEKNWKADRIFKPKMTSYERETRIAEWKKAVQSARSFK